MLAHPNGLDMHFVYRALNSPLAEKVLRRHYNKLSERLIPKGEKVQYKWHMSCAMEDI